MTRTRLKYKSHSKAGRYITSYLLNNLKLVSLAAILLFGMICGALVTKNISSGKLNSLSSIFNGYITARNNQSFFSSFFNTLFSSLILPAISILFGLSAIGFPLVTAIPFFQGLGLGMIATYIYSSYGLHGIGYCLLIFFPYNVMNCAILLFFCKEGMTMSYGIFCMGRGVVNNFDVQKEMKLYFARVLIFLLFIVIASAVSAFSGLAFGRFFDL